MNIQLNAGDLILLDEIALPDFNAELIMHFDDDDIIYTPDEWNDGIETDADYETGDRFASIYHNGASFDIDADWIEMYFLEVLEGA